MRTTIPVLVALLVAVGAAQQVERTIWLPDSLVGASYPRAFALDSARDLVYVGGRYSNRLVVLEGRTGNKIGVVELSGIRRVNALYFNASNDRLYCLQGIQMSIVNGATRTLEKTVDLPSIPDSLVASPTTNRLYLYEVGSSDVIVFDCSADTIRTSFSIGTVRSACWSRATGKLYFAIRSQNRVVVVDGAADTVCAVITDLDYPSALASVRDGACVYCVDTHDDEIAVIDCAGDSVIARLPAGTQPTFISSSPATGKAYCGDYGGNDVLIYDAVADTSLGRVHLGSDPKIIAVSPLTGSVGATTSSNLTMISAQGDSAVATVPTGGTPRAATWNPSGDWLAIAVSAYNGIGVFDAAGNLLNKVILGHNPAQVAVNDATGQCVFAAAYYDSIFALDRPDAAPRPLCYGGADPWPLAFSSTGNRLYWSNYDEPLLLSFLDAAAETLVTSFVMLDVFTGTVTNPVTRMTYFWSEGWQLVAIDEEMDGLAAALYPAEGVSAIGCDPVNGSVYVAGAEEPGLVLDGRTCRLIDTIPGVVDASVVLCDSGFPRVFFLLPDSGLAVFESDSNTLLRVVGRPGWYYGTAVLDRMRHRAWVTGGDSLLVYDASLDSVITVLPLPGGVEMMLGDAAFVYVVGDDSLRAFDAQNCLPVGAAPLEDGPHTLALDRVHNRLYVSCYDAGCIQVITLPERSVVAGAPSDRRVCPPIVCNALPVTSKRPLMLVDAAGRRVLELLPGHNDISRVAAGVYFALDPGTGETHKVLVAR
jgi:YVTN family beta-propeller protein